MYISAFSKGKDLGLYLPPNAYEVYFMSLAHDENILDQAAVYPNASGFADHLVTLPCHEDIDKVVVDIIVDRLLATLNREFQ